MYELISLSNAEITNLIGINLHRRKITLITLVKKTKKTQFDKITLMKLCSVANLA